MQHKIKPTKEQLITKTKILDKATDKYRLAIKESLLIIANNPSINRQYNNFTNVLKLYPHNNLQDRCNTITNPNNDQSESIVQESRTMSTNSEKT